MKAIWAPPDPPQLFDLDLDPCELTNVAGRPDHADVWAGFAARFAERRDLAAFDKAVRASQRRRRLVYEGLRQGAYTPWDFEPQHEPAARRLILSRRAARLASGSVRQKIAWKFRGAMFIKLII